MHGRVLWFTTIRYGIEGFDISEYRSEDSPHMDISGPIFAEISARELGNKEDATANRYCSMVAPLMLLHWIVCPALRCMAYIANWY
jgi:hypothetical protein